MAAISHVHKKVHKYLEDQRIIPIFANRQGQNRINMTALSFTDFRKNMASSFDRVDAGEFVFISRGGKKKYAIIAMDDDDLSITPQMATKIEKARQEYKEGKTLKFENATAAQQWMDEL